jgi:hypothetical protein
MAAAPVVCARTDANSNAAAPPLVCTPALLTRTAAAFQSAVKILRQHCSSSSCSSRSRVAAEARLADAQLYFFHGAAAAFNATLKALSLGSQIR